MKHKVKRYTKSKQNIYELQDNLKWTNVDITGVFKGKEGELKNVFEEKIAENYPYMTKTINQQIEEIRQTPTKHKKLYKNCTSVNN